MKDRARIDRIENNYLPHADEQIRDLREALYGRENRNVGNIIDYYPTISKGVSVCVMDRVADLERETSMFKADLQLLKQVLKRQIADEQTEATRKKRIESEFQELRDKVFSPDWEDFTAAKTAKIKAGISKSFTPAAGINEPTSPNVLGAYDCNGTELREDDVVMCKNGSIIEYAIFKYPCNTLINTFIVELLGNPLVGVEWDSRDTILYKRRGL